MPTVLVVDDDPDILELLCTVLEQDGYTVERASEGIGALDILDRGRVDLLLTDVIMPGLNGFNLARMARTRRSTLKVLYLTGYYEQAKVLRDEGEKYGKLLAKPIRPAELRKEVGAALSN